MELFSVAQCVGYVAFALGVTAFFQKIDHRLKFFNASECLAYAVHFMLLGNYPGAASALISSVRSFLAIKIRSPLLAAVIIGLNIVVGLTLAKSWVGWFPVGASSIATLAVFTMRGVPMRLALLVSTFLWLANNIICGSIGGTLLETIIAIVNGSTMFRILRSPERRLPHGLVGAEDLEERAE
jgi:hypothetical protein